MRDCIREIECIRLSHAHQNDGADVRKHHFGWTSSSSDCEHVVAFHSTFSEPSTNTPRIFASLPIDPVYIEQERDSNQINLNRNNFWFVLPPLASCIHLKGFCLIVACRGVSFTFTSKLKRWFWAVCTHSFSSSTFFHATKLCPFEVDGPFCSSKDDLSPCTEWTITKTTSRMGRGQRLEWPANQVGNRRWSSAGIRQRVRRIDCVVAATLFFSRLFKFLFSYSLLLSKRTEAIERRNGG
jgi:hypothetical protein